MADELLRFLEDTQGREGLRAYLRWRLERQTAQLEQQVTADDVAERLEQLAEALSEAGFDATVDVAGDRFVLRQDHCAIYDVAKRPPRDVRLRGRHVLQGARPRRAASRAQQTRADGRHQLRVLRDPAVRGRPTARTVPAGPDRAGPHHALTTCPTT